jgi:hypothetical protein
MSGSEKVAVYRLHAAQCAELAHRTSHPDASGSLVIMSVAWLRLADLAEKNNETVTAVALSNDTDSTYRRVP